MPFNSQENIAGNFKSKKTVAAKSNNHQKKSIDDTIDTMKHTSTRTKRASKLRPGNSIHHAGKIWHVKKISPVKYQINITRTSVKAEDTVLTLLTVGKKDTKLLQVASEHIFTVLVPEHRMSQIVFANLLAV